MAHASRVGRCALHAGSANKGSQSFLLSQEEFLGTALANNYRRPVIGYEADVVALGRREVEAFFRRHYGPRNLVIAVVGDVTPDQVTPTFQLQMMSGTVIPLTIWPSHPRGSTEMLWADLYVQPWEAVVQGVKAPL